MVSIFIVLSGGIVRITGSGLGCPTWPACEAGSLTTTPELGIHGLIEFSNRALTGVLILAVGWAIVAARLQAPRIRALTRLAWSQFWLVIVNSIAGGISVLTGLNPYVVAMHFVLAMALLTTTTLTWHRARQSLAATHNADAGRSSGAAAILSRALLAITAVLIIVGTLVTGSGQHSGDSADVPRMTFVWAHITGVHAVLGVLTLALAVTLFAVVRHGSALVKKRVLGVIVMVSLQALIGFVQANTGSPAWLVALHVGGSALVWVGVLRVLLDVEPAIFSLTARDSPRFEAL